MNLLAKLFRDTLAPAPVQLRDIDGKFLPQRVAVRSRAIEMAARMGREDLIARLVKSPELPPATPERADRDFGLTAPPAGSNVEAGHGIAYLDVNGADVATFNFGDRA